jgi:protein-L-isoaspartate(D-aspartate) O-methyltransferase
MSMNDRRDWLRRRLMGRVEHARVVDALMATPRELYVPEELTDFAWEDRALPLFEGQTISQPTMVAIMLDALGPEARDTVLDVGTGSGYQAAILARLTRLVYGIELRIRLARHARRALRLDPGVRGNCELVVADAHRGFPGRIRFDGIVVAAATTEIPAALLDQLAPGGRLLAPVGPPSLQELVRIRRSPDGSFSQAEPLGGCAFVPLVRT